MQFPTLALDDLARRVLEGDVVFFIGAGFSVDSEGNTASRFMARLLIRLIGFSQAMSAVGGNCSPPLEAEGASMRDKLRQTFELRCGGPEPFPLLKSDLNKLANRYYEANEWFCGAFGELLAQAQKHLPDRLNELLAEVDRQEERIRLKGRLVDDESVQKSVSDKDKGPGFRPATDFRSPPLDEVPLRPAGKSSPFDPALFALAGSGAAADTRAAGKALFLDTMGFRNPRVMGGDPGGPGLEEVANSYAGKLFPRHHVLARLAREGVCSTTITANYDLLLEGAFRLAGFTETPPSGQFPPTTFQQLARITSAPEFFTKGKPHRTAVLMKMHGCAEHYRTTGYAPEQREELHRYLRAMVFTYREIQNWREDFWVADFIRSLLRTRTVVFCGYSTQDPVLHDTFRTVYEEMARSHPSPVTRANAAPPSEREPRQAPVFFAPGGEKKREFHGMAVLQAASAAVQARTAESWQHPNYVSFEYRSPQAFPNLDDLFRWLFHRFVRLRQEECLDTGLRRIALALLGVRVPDAEFTAVRGQFQELVGAECAAAERWADAVPSRWQHQEICAWTDCFHVGLLREFAAAEVYHRRQGPGTELATVRRHPWYYPTMQDAAWTAWGAVVEIALRRMVGHAHQQTEIGHSFGLARAAQCQQPTLLFPPPADPYDPQQPDKARKKAPYALTVQLGGFQRADRMARIQGHPARRVFWQLDTHDAPWRIAQTSAAQAEPDTFWRAFKQPIMRVPPADFIWRWASGTVRESDLLQVRGWLGLEPTAPTLS